MNSFLKKNYEFNEPETFRASNDYNQSMEVTTSMDGNLSRYMVRNMADLPKQIHQRNNSYM